MQWDDSLVIWDEDLAVWDEDLAVWDDTVIWNDSKEREARTDACIECRSTSMNVA